MLIMPAAVQEKNHHEAREGMTNHFNKQMEKILNENSKTDLYWILGKAKAHKHGAKTVMRPFLQACAVKPGVIRESFVYEVDNRKGTKTLLWVFHPGDILSFPSIGKTISVAGSKGATILPPK